MADTVLRVSTVDIVDNPAAVEEKINQLIAANYSGPDWVRHGPNWMVNSVTGEDVNLNQQAIAILQSEPPRQDAVAIVRDGETGEEKRLWVNQDAVKAAGGNMFILRDNLQAVLGENPLSGIPWWGWGLAAGAVYYLVAGRSSRRHGVH